MTKENRNKYWVRSGLFSFFEKGSGFVFNFGSVVILLRTLSKEDMGAWILFLTVCSFMEVSRIGLLQNALVKYISSEAEDQYRNILTSSVLLNIALTIFYTIVLFFSANWLGNLWGHEGLKTLFHIYIVTTLLLMPLNQMNYIQQANLDFKGIFWAGFIKQGTFFTYVLFIWLSNGSVSLSNLAMVQILGIAFALGAAFYFSKPYLRFSKTIDWYWVQKLLTFGKYAIGTNLGSMLYKSMDKMMLGRMVSVASVAIYELAVKVTSLLDIPTLSAAPVVFPQSAIASAKDGHAAAANLYEKSVGLILTIILPCILVVQLVPDLIITLIGGTQYLDSIPLLRIVIFFGFFTPFLYQTGMVLESIGKPKINFYFTLFSFFLNLLFNAIFITLFGIVGAAYGTLLTYSIVFVLGQKMLHKLVGVQTSHVFYNTLRFYKMGFSFLKNRSWSSNQRTEEILLKRKPKEELINR